MEIEVYDYSKHGEPMLIWLDRKRDCVLVMNRKQVELIKQDKWLRYLFRAYCERERVRIKVCQD